MPETSGGAYIEYEVKWLWNIILWQTNKIKMSGWNIEEVCPTGRESHAIRWWVTECIIKSLITDQIDPNNEYSYTYETLE